MRYLLTNICISIKYIVILQIAIRNNMNNLQSSMKPQDVVVLLKIIAKNSDDWQQKNLADELSMSQSEISQSVNRSKYAGLMDGTAKKVMRLAFMDFLQFGLSVVFPQQAGPIVRGIPTAHSTSPLNELIVSTELYIWPYSKGNIKGHSIIPLFKSVPEAALKDSLLYELLALCDAIRIGRAREKEIAINELKKRILHGK